MSAQDTALEELFQTLKLLSRELVAILRVLPRLSGLIGLSPLLARRLDLFIAKKGTADAGSLADFMANIVEASFGEKLKVLSLYDVKGRISYVVELLDRQVTNIKNALKITSFTSSSIPITIEPDENDNEQIRRLKKSQTSSKGPMTGFGLPFSTRGIGGPKGGGEDEDEEPDEVEELQKRLETAGLSPEATKVAERDVKRLKKMNPAQAEYGVLRTYLETLSEIPWSTVTDDQLGPSTLTTARKQLDDDHYGLEKVKVRISRRIFFSFPLS